MTMRWLLIVALFALSCGGTPNAVTAGPPKAGLARTGAVLPERWATRLDVDHTLTGRVFDVAAGAFVSRDELVRRLAAADFVLLGEKHDNPDHHRLQAATVRALLARGKKPAVGFEMIETDQQPAIDAFLKDNPTSAAGLGAAVKWDDRGWPTWGDYEPIAQAAVEAHLPIIAANLPHEKARALVHKGAEAMDAETLHALGLDQPLPADAERALAEELRASHCGHLPEGMIGPMALAQRARDATMAAKLLGAGGGRRAVLIAGAAHGRTDRGVPLALRAQSAAGGHAPPRVVSIAFLEVDHGTTTPGAYAASFGTAALPFDYVWFTPRANDDDPCEKFGKKR